MIAKKEVEYAKEIDDVMVMIIELVKDLKAKKGVAELAAENLPNLMNAMSGLDQLDEELAASKSVAMSTIGFRVGELAGELV
jgi:phosphoglycerate dehydrogenase-like enzyme